MLIYSDDPKSSILSTCYNWVSTSWLPDFLRRLHAAALLLPTDAAYTEPLDSLENTSPCASTLNSLSAFQAGSAAVATTPKPAPNPTPTTTPTPSSDSRSVLGDRTRASPLMPVAKAMERVRGREGSPGEALGGQRSVERHGKIRAGTKSKIGEGSGQNIMDGSQTKLGEGSQAKGEVIDGQRVDGMQRKVGERSEGRGGSVVFAAQEGPSGMHEDALRRDTRAANAVYLQRLHALVEKYTYTAAQTHATPVGEGEGEGKGEGEGRASCTDAPRKSDFLDNYEHFLIW